MRAIGLAVLATLAGACVAHAEEARHTTVTVYSIGIALVEDTRDVGFAAGRSTIQFPDVSAKIRPETASLAANGVTVVEQNFDFDLLTPAKLMEKALGQTVKIVRTNPGTGEQVEEEATVLSTQQGVVLKIGDRIEVLRDDGVPTRVIFDKVPENLRARPTLSILVASRKAGVRPATLSYITPGLGWKADYVANYDEHAGTLDLQGWVTLTNTTNVAYPDAKVKIATGAVSSGGLSGSRSSMRGNGAQEAGVSDKVTLFDLPEAVTIADKQSKQVGLVELKGVHASKVYRSVWSAEPGNQYSGTGKPAKAQVVLRFAAKDEAGREWRLPRGAFRSFVRDAKGEAQFVGETQIGDIATGGKVDAAISEAFDIEVQPKLVVVQQFGSSGRRRTMEYTVTNASDPDVEVEIEEGGMRSDLRVVAESVRSVALDAYRRQWTLRVPAKGKAVLNAVIEEGR